MPLVQSCTARCSCCVLLQIWGLHVTLTRAKRREKFPPEISSNGRWTTNSSWKNSPLSRLSSQAHPVIHWQPLSGLSSNNRWSLDSLCQIWTPKINQTKYSIKQKNKSSDQSEELLEQWSIKQVRWWEADFQATHADWIISPMFTGHSPTVSRLTC